MSDLKHQCQDINSWFMKNTYQYDIPYCFTAPYKNDQAYLSIFTTNIGLITSRLLQQIYKPIKICFFEGEGQSYKEINFISINRQIQFDYATMNKVFEYNIRLQMSWYILSFKNIKTHTINFHNFLNGGYRNYLFVPLKDDEIDYDLIQEFIKQRDGLQNGQCLSNLNLEEELKLDYLFYIPKTQQLCGMYTILENLQQTVKQYFQELMKHSNYSLEQLCEYYSVDDEVLNQTISYFLYQHKIKGKTENFNSILQLRTLQSTLNQRESKLAIVKQVQSISKIIYYSEEQIISIENKSNAQKIHSCKPSLELCNFTYQIFPIQHLHKYPFTVEQYDNFLSLPKVMLELEQQLIVSEFASSIGIQPSIQVQRAISKPAYNRELNYELLETLGDSILKFLATLYVSLGTQNTNENILSDQRSQIVNNNFIGKHMYEFQYFGAFYFIRSLGHQTKWFSPVLQNIHNNHIQPEPNIKIKANLLTSYLADLFESLIATVFLDKYSMQDVYKFLLYLRHPVSYYPWNEQYYPQQSIVEQFNFPPMHNYMTFQELVNPVSSIPEQLLKQYQSNQMEYFYYLQNEIIEYQFKNKYILYESYRTQGYNMDIDLPLELYFKFLQNSNTLSTRGHQMLELLGDAVLECYIMCTCFNQIVFKFTPTNLYKIKMVLLSNSFLSKIAICYNIIPNYNDKVVQQFIKTVKLDEKFTHYNGNFVRVPKILSDTFEALIGAIFMDGGWQPVCKFLKKVYLKFIPFVCTYLNEIDDHVIDRVHQYSASKQGHMDIKSFKLESGLFCYEIRIDGQIVGRFAHEHERVAKEKACESACKRLKI